MNYTVDQELIDRLTALLKKMRNKEQRRKRKATKDFLAMMDRLEAEALAEIKSSAIAARYKVLRIKERLYGPDYDPDRIKKLFDAVYETELQ